MVAASLRHAVAHLSEFLISFTGLKMIDFQQHDSQRYRLVTINHF